MNRFRWWYNHVILFDYLYKTQIINSYKIPRLLKINVNTGVKQGVLDPKAVIPVIFTLKCITNQKPIFTLAKKSIANYKLRKGFPIGVKVTLRDQQMEHFFDQLINIVLPRVRDFRGFKTSQFDTNSNLNIGIHDLFLFPQIEAYYDLLSKDLGCTISINVSNNDYIPNSKYTYLKNKDQYQKRGITTNDPKHHPFKSIFTKEWNTLFFSNYQVPFLVS